MPLESSKVQITKSSEGISISDRMPINYRENLIALASICVFVIWFLGLSGIVYVMFFSTGYFLFRYFAWIIWRRIEIDIQKKCLTVCHMRFDGETRKEIISTKFSFDDLILKEFEQSGMQRAMIQYQSHKLNDLLLLTHQDDIELVRKEVFSSTMLNN